MNVLEPTHIKEYTDVNELLDIIKNNNFLILDYDLIMFKYPIIDIILKLLTKLFKNKIIFNFVNSKCIMFLSKYLVIPIFGFYNFQILAKKKG